MNERAAFKKRFKVVRKNMTPGKTLLDDDDDDFLGDLAKGGLFEKWIQKNKCRS